MHFKCEHCFQPCLIPNLWTNPSAAITCVCRHCTCRLVSWGAHLMPVKNLYCHDQALVYAHALLATRHCGIQDVVSEPATPVNLGMAGEISMSAMRPALNTVLAMFDLDEFFHAQVGADAACMHLLHYHPMALKCIGGPHTACSHRHACTVVMRVVMHATCLRCAMALCPSQPQGSRRDAHSLALRHGKLRKPTVHVLCAVVAL